jgi:hypothetical protein
MSALWAITCFFNPAGYRRRLQNYKWFREHLTIPLVTVELSFTGEYALRNGDAEILVQLDQGDVLFQKERLLNIALQHLPATCEAVTWIDCDVIFAANDWPARTMEALQRFDVVQPFSERFDLRSLKPLQVAIISLIEDARVEQLAMRGLPGLFRLWAPFHLADSDGSSSVLPLLARLSRSLIDPNFVDNSPWVRKGREMFFDSQSEWHDQSMSRRIGGLLGNDLGQMRVQFNQRTYVVQPPYRDDNLGI